ncbi:MAG: type II toxin-antitoxin system HicA family toxin [Oscillospiraceae bacterium]|nr:type II toxin-antitoxin system HicA family toxin [Oscillospiraceae bacterium]
MTASELTKLARKNGCQIKRHGSGHDIWINPKTGGTAPIPRHPGKEVATGTAHRIMKDLGLK